MPKTIKAVFIIPEIIKVGLDKGVYERIGGVIRKTTNKEVVFWLKEGGSVTPKAQKITITLSSLGRATLAFADFLYMNEKFKEINKILKGIDMKLDAQNLSKIQSGFTLAKEAEQMRDLANAKMQMNSARSLLEEGSNIFKNLFRDINKSSKLNTDESFNALRLAILAELGVTRTYLWNDEFLTAYGRVENLFVFLKDAYKIYRDYTSKLLELRNSENPYHQYKGMLPDKLPNWIQEELLNFTDYLTGYLIEIDELQKYKKPLRDIFKELPTCP